MAGMQRTFTLPEAGLSTKNIYFAFTLSPRALTEGFACSNSYCSLPRVLHLR